MTSPAAPLLVLRGIAKSFAGVRALRGVDFDLQRRR
jgi:ABC-type sugar transport system ATPase subunit